MRTTPNVIHIYADDLGRGMLGSYGQTRFATPHIDRLAGEGMRFTRAYGCAFCAPARASLLCGVHDVHAGRWTFTRAGVYMALDHGTMSLPEIYELIHTTGIRAGRDDVFLPQLFQRAGYITGQIGKLEWGFATTGDELVRHGWDYHYGDYDHQRCHGYYPTFLFENGVKVDIEGNAFADCGARRSAFDDGARIDMTGRAVYSQDVYDRKIVEFIRAHRERPFYLFHPSQLPHGPVFCPKLDPAVADDPDLTLIEKEYASMVLRLDRTVGLILDELDALGLTDDTLVLFSADNGHTIAYGQPGRVSGQTLTNGAPIDNVRTKFHSDTCGDVFDGNDGMAGLKLTSWDGGVKVPLLARWPGRIPAGSVSDRLVAGYDLMPTFAELLGTDMPPGKDGVSFASALTDSADASVEREYVVFASYLGPAIVTAEGWKLRCVIDADRYRYGPFGAMPGDLGDAVQYQLYHLGDDYREERNVIDRYPHVAEGLRRKLVRECDGNLRNGTPQAHFAFYGTDPAR